MDTDFQATLALREVVAKAGMQPDEYALHSLRIGGATYLSAGGVPSKVLKREGRWSSDAYKTYVRSHDGVLVGSLICWLRRVQLIAKNSQGKEPFGDMYRPMVSID